MNITRMGLRVFLAALFTGAAGVSKAEDRNWGAFESQAECAIYAWNYCAEWCEYLEQECDGQPVANWDSKTKGCKGSFQCAS
jgi:hypothetical protein